MSDMFREATSFKQNLCPWQSRMSSDVYVSDMFVGSACPNWTDPLLPCGPFCFGCSDVPPVNCRTVPMVPACKDDEILVVVKVLSDLVPDETVWQVIHDKDGSIVVQGDALYNRTAALCLTMDCYTFTIYDASADGICCSYGGGQYSIFVDSDLIATGGNFTSLESVSFGGNDCSKELECSSDEILLQVELLPDGFPEETSWEVVRDANGFVILQGSGFGKLKNSICLPSLDCYTLHNLRQQYGWHLLRRWQRSLLCLCRWRADCYWRNF